jgi:hypothetical protein
MRLENSVDEPEDFLLMYLWVFGDTDGEDEGFRVGAIKHA